MPQFSDDLFLGAAQSYVGTNTTAAQAFFNANVTLSSSTVYEFEAFFHIIYWKKIYNGIVRIIFNPFSYCTCRYQLLYFFKRQWRYF